LKFVESSSKVGVSIDVRSYPSAADLGATRPWYRVVYRIFSGDPVVLTLSIGFVNAFMCFGGVCSTIVAARGRRRFDSLKL
jgi:hypothetical protein